MQVHTLSSKQLNLTGQIQWTGFPGKFLKSIGALSRRRMTPRRI